jgi:hypothetical protein
VLDAASVGDLGLFLPVRATRSIIVGKDDKQAPRQPLKVTIYFIWETVAYASNVKTGRSSSSSVSASFSPSGQKIFLGSRNAPK